MPGRVVAPRSIYIWRFLWTGCHRAYGYARQIFSEQTGASFRFHPRSEAQTPDVGGHRPAFGDSRNHHNATSGVLVYKTTIEAALSARDGSDGSKAGHSHAPLRKPATKNASVDGATERLRRRSVDTAP